ARALRQCPGTHVTRPPQRLCAVVLLMAKIGRIDKSLCLYLIVGDAVRSNFNTSSRAEIETMLTRAAGAAVTDRAVGRWISESRDLMEHAERLDYRLWCDGGLAARAAAFGADRSGWE